MCYWLVIQIVMHVINCSLTYLTLISIYMTLYNVEGMPQDVVTFLVWQICKGCVNIMWFNHAKNRGFFAFRVINLFIFDIVWLYYINIMLNMHQMELSYQVLTSNNSFSVDVWPNLYIYRYLTFLIHFVHL